MKLMVLITLADILLVFVITAGGCADLDHRPEQSHDVAVTHISAPSSCVQGDTVPVVVTVENQGTCSESLVVKLSDITDALEVRKQTVSLSVSAAAACDLTITGEEETTTQFGDWSWVGDVNKDGYDDILISAAQWKHDGGINDGRGRAYLFYGGKNMDAIPDKIFTGENAGDEFSDNGVYLADMNNDGFDDVILGDRKYGSGDDGRVYIFYGGTNMNDGSAANADIIIDAPSVDGSGIQFGRGVAAGDLNNDGHMDLLVSAIYYQSLKGRTYLYYGPIASDTTVDKTFTGEGTHNAFGAKISARGDVDGDNCDDLIIGTMYYPDCFTSLDGRVYFYYGAPGISMDEHPDLIFDAEYSGDEFGCDVDLFDIDNDGYADIIIGARRYPNVTFQGRVYLYWGSDRASMDNDYDLYFDGEAGAKAALGGESVMGGYVNDDEYGDIVVSAFDYKNFSQHGRAYLYYGGPKGSMDTTCDHTFTGEEADCQPQRTRIADFNGDGYGDIIMQGYEYNNFQGRCWLWYGGFKPSSTDVTFNWDTTKSSTGEHTLKAEIIPVAGEEDTADNSRTITVNVKSKVKEK